MKAGIFTVILLIISNVFMTAAWYGNLKLKEMHISTDWPLILVILASWGVALIEYFFMIPANNIGSRINGGPFSLMQLKIIQEAISITVFTTMAITMFRTETLQWNHIVAFVLVMLLQVRSEEKRLRRDFGDEYEQYCRRTGRFFPKK